MRLILHTSYVVSWTTYISLSISIFWYRVCPYYTQYYARCSNHTYIEILHRTYGPILSKPAKRISLQKQKKPAVYKNALWSCIYQTYGLCYNCVEQYLLYDALDSEMAKPLRSKSNRNRSNAKCMFNIYPIFTWELLLPGCTTTPISYSSVGVLWLHHFALFIMQDCPQVLIILSVLSRLRIRLISSFQSSHNDGLHFGYPWFCAYWGAFSISRHQLSSIDIAR